MRYIIQYIASSAILLLATLSAWYEGSGIREDPFEWKYSAIFSKAINGSVTSPADILLLDHFVYAVKFKPLYPLIMVICSLYLLTLTAMLLLKFNTKKLAVYHGVLGVSLMVAGFIIKSSPTTGLSLFMWFFTITGILNLITSVFIKDRYPKENEPVT